MSPMRLLAAACLAACTLASAVPAGAVTPNGRLQIIHLDVGQGDGAVLITPLGQVVMFDDGVNGNPTPACGVKVPAQLQALGVTHVDYHFVSHYHSDHIGLFGPIFGAGGIATIDYGWDRAGSYTTSYYTTYVNTIGTKRRTLVKGQVITLDSLSAHPVTIKVVDLAGCGLNTSDENSLSVELKVSYGEFDESFGGDLQGSTGGGGVDGESIAGPEEGPVEVYKVHHHGSKYSTNDNWLNAIQPKIAVISAGNGNSYGHPTSDALGRLHNHNVHTYWTETGAGVTPNPTWDKVSNNQIVISATWQPGGVDTIRGTGFADTFTNSGTAVDTQAPVVTLTSPNGAQDWKAGSTQAITWNATDNVGVTAVDLAWSTDGGSTYPNAIASGLANTGTYAWTVPDTSVTDARVRVTAHDAAGNAGTGASAGDFTIDTWTISASAGSGGSIVPSGDVPEVQGASQHFSIAPGTGYQMASLVVDGAPVAPDTTYLFTAVATNHTIGATFLDVMAPTVRVTSPVGGERWDEGSAQTITWTATDNAGVDSVEVDCSLTGYAGPWLEIAHGLANSGSLAWTVPSLPSDSALVRVTAFDHAHNAGSGTSDSLFDIPNPNTGVGDAGPAVLALLRPQPNPSAGATLLRFSLPQAGRARVEVVDLAGRRVWARDQDSGPGESSIAWNGTSASGAALHAGLYFVRLITPWGTRTQRMARL